MPLTVEAPRIKALASARLTLLPLVMLTAPVKLLAALLKVMSLAAPAAKVVTPVTASTPLWVMAPEVVTPKVPLMVEAPRIDGVGVRQADVVAASSPPRC